jgi:hypothetical protein
LCVGNYTVSVTDANGCKSSSFTPVSGCFQIQSILVDGCTNPEQQNEMVFFQVGQNPINTSTTAVNWPSNIWKGFCSNTTFISNVNSTITGGGVLLPMPATGILPANSNVVLITNSTITTSANSFSNLTETLYAIFQCNNTDTTAQFRNYSSDTTLTRSFNMGFGGCYDTVIYKPSLLINSNGTSGGSSASNNGAYVNFSQSGTATYLNNSCRIPFNIQSAQVALTAPSPTSSS